MDAAVKAFRDLHRAGQPLVLPNAWDVASAAALVDAGFTAIGTTSLGVAAANGLPDASGATRAETVQLATRLARLPCLLTVDIETGFGAPAEVAEELAAAGAGGVNLEDARGPVDEQCAAIAAIKERVPELFLNARTDTHWLVEAPDLDEAVTRVRAYRAAGADGVFVPGLVEPDDIRAVVRAVDAPLNVLYAPGRHTVVDLADLGVARVSCGSLLFRVALGATVDAARAVRDAGPLPSTSLPSYADVVND